MKKTKNPLRHRLPRELKSDFGKYMVIFLLLVLSIGLISGFLVADESMIAAYNESFEKYNIEDGNFTVEYRANKSSIRMIEDLGVKVYELFFTDRKMDNGVTVRIFKNRTAVDLPCPMEGSLPEETGEIAVDRMFADNNSLKTGDILVSSGKEWKITGLVALSDYSALFSDNSDTMFDALHFGVAVVCEEEFESFSKNEITWRYAWKYNEGIGDKAWQKDRAERFSEDLSGIVDLVGFNPRFQNQAIIFTGDDMGSDRAMMMVLLYVIIVIIAFVFAVTISNTIVKESNVIGTLRASGYTKGELIRHYMTMPLFVTLVAALVGNVLGYTVFKDVCADLYYNSYSLPTYVTLWNADAFFETTVVPIVIMIVIDFLILSRRLALSPLKFLRRDLKKGRSRGAFPLSAHFPFFTRFRVRVIFQNMPNYIVLFAGILFANFLLMFGLMLPEILHHYEETLPDSMFSEYQYILQLPQAAVDEDKKLESMMNMLKFQNAVETDVEDAEKFSAYSLQTVLGETKRIEDVLVYGIANHSRYLPLDDRFREMEKAGFENPVLASSNYRDKMKLKIGDRVTLKEEFEDAQYSFTIAGFLEYTGSICVFMPKEKLNEIFDLGKGTFTGYFSNTPITDIDKSYIGQTIDRESLTKVSRQLMKSMGGMMYLVDYFSMLMFMILIYILSKIIIEKNAQSISMTKILGYRNGEISRLYLHSTTLMTILEIFLSLPLCTTGLVWIYEQMIVSEMTGWIPYYLPRKIYIQMIIMGIVTYAVVAVLEYQKIRKVPMDEALKNVE